MKNFKVLVIIFISICLFSLNASMQTRDAEKIISSKKLKNQLKNGTFSAMNQKGNAENWHFWKKNDSHGKVQFEKNAGVNQSAAAVLSGGSGSVYNFANIENGEIVYVKFKVKQIGKVNAVFSMRFQDLSRKWLPETFQKPVTFAESNSWNEIAFIAEIPEKARIAVPMFGLTFAESSDCRFILDDVEIYFIKKIIPEKNLPGYKDMAKAATAESIIVENFDGPLNGWTLNEHFMRDAHAGVTGSGALVAERKVTNESPSAKKIFKLRHGVVYRLSLTYRSQMKFDPKLTMQELFCVRFFKNGKYGKGSFYGITEPGSAENWKTMKMTFQVPDDCDSDAVVSLFIRTARIGKVWYDNLTIEPISARSCYVYLLSPAAYQLDESGKIKFGILLPAKSKVEDLRLLLVINGKEYSLPVKNNAAVAELGNLPAGNYPAEFLLIDTKKKEIIGRDRAVFYRQTSKNPNRVTVGPDGFLRRHGKKYLPIGIFLGALEKWDKDIYKRVKEGGFNSVEALGRHQRYHGQKGTMLNSIKLGIREMAKHDLTFLYGIKYQLPSQRPGFRKMDGVEGLENVTEYMIKGVKDEPNLLGWYVSDENPISQIPEILNLRQTLAKYDPDHPTFTLTNIEGNFYDFARTGDYLMTDVYPIGDNTNQTGIEQDMSLCRNHLEKAKLTGSNVVWVPQIFAWKAFRKKDPVFRYPTEQEIRSMVLVGTVYGVKAYYFYAYHPIFYYSEKMDPGKSGEQWARVVPAAKLLQELTPYILSDEKAPDLTIKQIKGKKIVGRALQYNKRVAVVLTADGPGDASAEIKTVPGLVSRYGKTKETAPGVYVFTAKHVDSDVLFSK